MEDYDGVPHTVPQQRYTSCTIRRAAVAAGYRNVLAALLRLKDETRTDLLDQLDQSLDKAIDEKIYTDELNS